MPHASPIAFGSSYTGIFKLSGMGPAGTVPNNGTWDCTVTIATVPDSIMQLDGLFVFAQAPSIQGAATIISAFLRDANTVIVRWMEVGTAGPGTNVAAAVYDVLLIA